MRKLRMAVLGASGIGKFHARELKKNGVDVVAILGSSLKSAKNTSAILFKEYGIEAKAYFNLSELLNNESLDAVCICIPPNLHYAQAKMCLKKNLHILCEKPIVHNGLNQNSKFVVELIRLAKKHKKILTVNTQWPSVIPVVKAHLKFKNLKDFFMFSQPGDLGDGMLADHLPHANSLLVKLIPKGVAKNIHITKISNKHIIINFIYINQRTKCKTQYEFKYKADRPRDILFSFNGVKYKRGLGNNYQQFLISDKEQIPIADPLSVSVSKFVNAIRKKDFPLVSMQEIEENMKLQDSIITAYHNQNKTI